MLDRAAEEGRIGGDGAVEIVDGDTDVMDRYPVHSRSRIA